MSAGPTSRSRGCTTTRALVKQFRQATQEPLVLGLGAVADAEVTGSAEGLAGTDRDLALGEAGDHRGFVGVAEVDPGEVGVRVAGPQVEAAEPLLDGEPSGDGALDPAQDVVL